MDEYREEEEEEVQRTYHAHLDVHLEDNDNDCPFPPEEETGNPGSGGTMHEGWVAFHFL